jgi:hypothetical protein
MLVVLGEQLGLDGLIFVPAHYFIADRARFAARFLDPVEEARFGAVQQALRHLRLREASAAVAAGRVRDVRTGEAYTYRPRPLLIPLTDDLREGAPAADHRRRVAAAAADLAYELVPPT